MTLDDRERNFEKAMARELRGDALNGLHCPDEETLAAYHERLLSAEEMAVQKSHIAACARCQEILATMEITETVSTEAEDSKNAIALSGLAAAAAASTSKVRAMPKPKTYLRWAVPAGAIAAGFLVWVAINFSRNENKAASYVPTQVAENRASKEAQLSAPKAEPSAPAAKTQGRLKADSDLKQTLDLNEETDKLVAMDRLQKSVRVQPKSAANFPHGPGVVQNQTQNQIQNNANAKLYSNAQNQEVTSTEVGGRTGKSATPTPPPENAHKRLEEATKPAAPQPTTDAGARARKDEATTVQSAAAEISAETKSVGKEKAKKAPGADANRQEYRLVQNEANLDVARLGDIAATGGTIVWTSDAKVFWMLLADGTVLKNENAGKIVAKQDLGAGVRVIAGSATDAKTCWMLAEDNVVFRTVDGGKHWIKTTAPNGGEFKTIVATDALHAAISDTSGKAKYQTSDGGTTWSALGRP